LAHISVAKWSICRIQTKTNKDPSPVIEFGTILPNLPCIIFAHINNTVKFMEPVVFVSNGTNTTTTRNTFWQSHYYNIQLANISEKWWL